MLFLLRSRFLVSVLVEWFPLIQGRRRFTQRAGASSLLGFVYCSAFQRVIVTVLMSQPMLEAYHENREVRRASASLVTVHISLMVHSTCGFVLLVEMLRHSAMAKQFELLPVPSDPFGCPGWLRVRLLRCVPDCVGSLAAWELSCSNEISATTAENHLEKAGRQWRETQSTANDKVNCLLFLGHKKWGGDSYHRFCGVLVALGLAHKMAQLW